MFHTRIFLQAVSHGSFHSNLVSLRSARYFVAVIESFPGLLSLRDRCRFILGTFQTQRLVTERGVHVIAMMRLCCIIMLVRTEISTGRTHSSYRNLSLLL